MIRSAAVGQADKFGGCRADLNISKLRLGLLTDSTAAPVGEEEPALPVPAEAVAADCRVPPTQPPMPIVAMIATARASLRSLLAQINCVDFNILHTCGDDVCHGDCRRFEV